MSRHLGRTVLALAALAFAMPAFANPACDAASAYSAARHGAAVLVMQNGKVICETFAGEGSVDHRMELASGTKSFTGMMLAAAVQDKLLTLDEPVAKTLPEWREIRQRRSRYDRNRRQCAQYCRADSPWLCRLLQFQANRRDDQSRQQNDRGG